MKKILLIIVLIFFSCKKSIDKFEVENRGSSNFTINKRELFPQESLTITVNEKYIYKYSGKYWTIKYYKLPVTVKKIEIKSNIGNRIILNETILDSLEKNKELIITTPFPKDFKDSIFPKGGFGKITVENSERTIRIKYY